MTWTEPKVGDLVTCESAAAIVLHTRRVTDAFPVKLGGHHPRPVTLCGSEAAWDTQRPLSAVHCRSCLSEMAAEGGAVIVRPLVKVAAGMAVDASGRVLMGRRLETGTRPGMWEMPGGKRERDEILLNTLVREWNEELGVVIEAGDHISTARFSLEVDLEIELWSVRIVSGSPQLRVHTELRWVDLPDAIVNLACAPATYLHYRGAMRHIGSLRGRS